MKETVTVEKALIKGRWKLKHLPMIITFSFIIGGYIFYSLNIFDGWVIALGFFLGFVFGWLVWSYYVSEWKIWAFENVRNIHELQRKAVEEKLIWQNGSFFEKTEFKDYQQKQKLKQLEKKFLEKDVYKDDINIPKKTLIFYSKGSLKFLIVISGVLFFLGLYFISNEKYFAVFIVLFGVYMAYDNIKKLKDNDPQITINEEGIKLKNEKLVSWNKIYNDRVFARSSGRSSKNYLGFNDEMIEIDDLSINKEDLENLLHVYRVRFENNSTLQ